MGFASADATSAEVTGGAGGRVQVKFVRSFVCRRDLVHRGAAITSHPCARGAWLGGGDKDGGDGVCRWDLLRRMQPAPR